MKSELPKTREAYLLDEIGGIQDSFLLEAQPGQGKHPRSSRHSRRAVTRWGWMVASLLLVCGLVLAGPSLLKRAWSEGDNKAPSHELPADSSLAAFHDLFTACTQSTSFLPRTEQEVSFFDGRVHVVLLDEKSGSLYVSRSLTQTEQSMLAREWTSSAAAVGEGEDTSAFRVWITWGNGFVSTPCLTPHRGNLGAATLFDYASERVPTKNFQELLSSLL